MLQTDPTRYRCPAELPDGVRRLVYATTLPWLGFTFLLFVFFPLLPIAILTFKRQVTPVKKAGGPPAQRKTLDLLRDDKPTEDPNARQLRSAYGVQYSQVMAQAVVAAQRTGADDRQIHSVHG